MNSKTSLSAAAGIGSAVLVAMASGCASGNHAGGGAGHGPITEAERREIIAMSPVGHLYDETVDRDSAFEVLKRRADEAARMEERQQAREEQETARRGAPRRPRSGFELPDFGTSPAPAPSRSRTRSSRSRSDSVADAAVKSVVRSLGSALGRALARSVLGSIKRGF